MLYTNMELKADVKWTESGGVDGVEIVKSERKRPVVFLRTPSSVSRDDVIKEFRPDLTICTSKYGKPRIVEREDDNVYLILSSKRDHEGRGYISAPKNQKLELITQVTCTDRDDDCENGYSWDVAIVKAKDGDVFKITWSTKAYYRKETLYVVAGGKVYVADLKWAEYVYDRLGLEVPFSLRYEWKRGGFVIDPDEWIIIEAE